ncbi:MAG: PKD domain-containing protein [Methanoregula sp.]
MTLIIPLGSAEDTRELHEFITPAERPVAIFATFYSDNTVPTAITFRDYSTGTPPLTYTWEFGDGTMSNEQNPIHVYQFEGRYDVRLAVSNQYGSDTIHKTITPYQRDTSEPFPLSIPLSEITIPVTTASEMRAPVFTQPDIIKTTNRFSSRTLGSVLLLSTSSIVVIGLLVIAMRKQK